MGKKQQLSWGIWFCGMAGIFGAALASCLDGTLLSGLGCGLLAALAGAAVWRLVLVNGAALPQLSRGEWLLLSLPGVALGWSVAAVPLTGVLPGLFFLLILAAALLVLGRRNAFSLSGVVLAVLLCWFCCYCALSPLCLSRDSYSYYEMSQTLFTDFGRWLPSGSMWNGRIMASLFPISTPCCWRWWTDAPAWGCTAVSC